MKFEVYRSRDGQFRWRLLADNHKKIAVSGESYRNWQDCCDGIILVRKIATEAPIVDKTQRRTYTKRTSPKAEV